MVLDADRCQGGVAFVQAVNENKSLYFVAMKAFYDVDDKKKKLKLVDNKSKSFYTHQHPCFIKNTCRCECTARSRQRSVVAAQFASTHRLNMV